jgi:ubiquinone/menaquinone biosynthesis C-methylase UbiE
MKQLTAFLLLALLMTVGSLAFGLNQPTASEPESTVAVQRDVPYVPTPMEVVEEMLRMAEVGPDDVLYDLGSGDGRIVVTAAKKWGTRGVGVDIDPERIRESLENARRSQVTERVKFIEGDLFDVDISEATVVTLYLLPAINIRLRPKLFEELRPGTRVVSHDFDMGEWPPDQKTEVSYHKVLFWIIPANISGTWQWENEATGQQYLLEIDQHFQEADGTIIGGENMVEEVEVKLEGDLVRFTAEEIVDGQSVTVHYEGRAGGDAIVGTRQYGANSQQKEWQATRKPATRTPLDTGEIRL